MLTILARNIEIVQRSPNFINEVYKEKIKMLEEKLKQKDLQLEKYTL